MDSNPESNLDSVLDSNPESNLDSVLDSNPESEDLDFGSNLNSSSDPDSDSGMDSCPNSYLDTSINSSSISDNYLHLNSLESEVNFKSEFRKLVLQFPGVPRVFLNHLLKLFQRYPQSLNIKNLDIRSVLQTKRNLKTKEISPGIYYHFGLEKAFFDHINFFKQFTNFRKIFLNINIDGLPITNSTTDSFWPILGTFFLGDILSNVFVIGLYFGKKKPNNINEYLKDFVCEYNDIKTNGILYNGVKCLVQIRSVICDAPARSFISSTVSHNSFFACNKCIQKGKHDGTSVIFKEINCLPYTDLDFKNKVNKYHHSGNSILEDTGIGMVSQMPYEYMHLVLLGAVKKLMTYWIKGPQKETKFSPKVTSDLDKLIVSLNCFIPREFQRKHRLFSEYRNWKAVEFRMFLLYTGPIILKKFLPKPYYYNFLTLHYAIKILVSDKYKEYNDYANDLLKYFVTTGTTLYEHFPTFNIHCLIHLANDCLTLGPLDSFSAFPYENFMQKLKKLPRKYNKKMEQVILRLYEISFLPDVYQNKIQKPILSKKLNNSENLYYKILFQNFYFDCGSFKDSICVAENNVILKIEYFEFVDDIIICYGRKFKNITRFFPGELEFDTGQDSMLDIYLFESIDENLKKFPFSEIKSKAVCFMLQNENIIIPLTHF